VDDKHRMHQIVWLALLGSILFYAAMPLFLAPVMDAPPPGLALAVVAATVSATGLVFALPRLMSQLPAATDEAAGVRAFQTKIVQWALCEAMVIFGLVLYVLGGGTTWLWALCAWGSVLMGMHGPREAAVGDARDLARPDVKIG
jgi:hypothetical protein